MRSVLFIVELDPIDQMKGDLESYFNLSFLINGGKKNGGD